MVLCFLHFFELCSRLFDTQRMDLSIDVVTIVVKMFDRWWRIADNPVPCVPVAKLSLALLPMGYKEPASGLALTQTGRWHNSHEAP